MSPSTTPAAVAFKMSSPNGIADHTDAAIVATNSRPFTDGLLVSERGDDDPKYGTAGGDARYGGGARRFDGDAAGGWSALLGAGQRVAVARIGGGRNTAAYIRADVRSVPRAARYK